MCKGNYYCISSKVKHHTSKASHELENLLTEILNYKATLLKTSKYWYSPTANLVCKEEKSKYNVRYIFVFHISLQITFPLLSWWFNFDWAFESWYQISDWVWRGTLEEIAVAMAMILLMLTQRTRTTDQWQLWDSSIYGSSFYPYFVFAIGIPTYSISDLVSTIYVIHFDFDYIRWLNENTTVYCSKHLVLFYDMHNLNILVSCLFDLDSSLMLHV